MDELAIARMIHILAIVCWTGGFAFVTTLIIPTVQRLPAGERLTAFHRVKGRFAPQARIWVVPAGASGPRMFHRGECGIASAIPHLR